MAANVTGKDYTVFAIHPSYQLRIAKVIKWFRTVSRESVTGINFFRYHGVME